MRKCQNNGVAFMALTALVALTQRYLMPLMLLMPLMPTAKRGININSQPIEQ